MKESKSNPLPCPNRKQSRKRWQLRLLEYRQDFLKPREREVVERHLLHCEECRKLLVEVTVFLEQLDMAMALMVSKVPIQNLELEAYRLSMQKKAGKLLN